MGGFNNSIVGGAEQLIRSGIKSLGYVANTTGWRIAKNGVADLAQATIRGTIVVGSNTITLDSTGIHVIGSSRRWDIDSTNGFMSRRIPDDGTKGQMFDAGIFLTPPNPTPNDGATFGASGQGQVFAGNTTITGPHDAPFTNLVSPNYNGKPGTSGFYAQGQSANSATDNSQAIISGHNLTVNSTTVNFAATSISPQDDTIIDTNHHYYTRGENGAFVQPVTTGNVSFVDTVTFTHTFSRAPCVVTNVLDGGTNTKAWLSRAINITTTQFQYFFYNPTGAGAAGSSSATLQWAAFEFTP